MTICYSTKKQEPYKTAIYIKKAIINTPQRRDFIFSYLKPTIEAFEKETGMDVRISGMPYIRTLNAQNIQDEIPTFCWRCTRNHSTDFLFLFPFVQSYFHHSFSGDYWSGLGIRIHRTLSI